MTNSNSIETVRHSCAHVMAAAIQQLWPEAQFGVGPSIENGFYYDLLFPEPIKFEHLKKIEARMKKIKKKKALFVHENMSTSNAIDLMSDSKQKFKVELIALLKEKGSTAVSKETGDENIGGDDDGVDEVSIYRVGNFIDLCRGPHIEKSNEIGVFKVHKLAGAYWRGDEKREQMQRIYGLCYHSEEELKAEIERLEQVKLRDHRRIGKELEIYHLSREVGQGLPLWLPNGTILRDELELLAKEAETKAGYERVVTPHITNEKLYYQSGHLPYYKDDMYAPIEIENNNYYLRPMNCPHHHHIYLSKPRSYRDMPVRLSEYGQVYRYEDSGSLSGLMRTRGFCQNDAHIYCRYDQAKDEFLRVMDMHAQFYKLFGVEDFYMRLSLPDLEKLDKYVNQPEQWMAALDVIKSAMNESGLPYTEIEGEAAFYGPKIDFMIKNVIGTEVAISTNQLDFLASERFDLCYIGEDGEKHPVYVIHRAPLGSHERFVAFLIEHYYGIFPVWLAPIQMMIVPISSKHEEYANEVRAHLTGLKVANGSLGLRVKVDDSNERMQKKVRNATVKRIPYIIILGDKEAETKTVTIRNRQGDNFGPVDYTALAQTLKEAVEQRNDSILLQFLEKHTEKT